MPRGENRKTGRHRFENGIGNAFLVLVRRGLARMQEKMRAGVELHQFRLGKKAAEMNLVDDPEFLGQFFQVRLERAFAGDDQLGVREFLLENGERAKRSGDPFFRNQAAGLHESPAAVRGRLAANKGKFIQRHAGPVDAQTLRRTTEGQEPIRQRLRTRQDERDGVKQIPQLRAVIADVLFFARRRRHETKRHTAYASAR